MRFTVKGSSVVCSTCWVVVFFIFFCEAVSQSSFLCCSTLPHQTSICAPSKPSVKHVGGFLTLQLRQVVCCFLLNGERCFRRGGGGGSFPLWPSLPAGSVDVALAPWRTSGDHHNFWSAVCRETEAERPLLEKPLCLELT